jgi:hypothetical protein
MGLVLDLCRFFVPNSSLNDRNKSIQELNGNGKALSFPTSSRNQSIVCEI